MPALNGHEVEVEVMLNSQQQSIEAPAVLQPSDQAQTDANVISPFLLSSKSLWVLFALGWFFPPCWWVAAAAGLQGGGDAQCLIQRRQGQSKSHAAAWRASVVMTVLSAAVLVLVLPIYYGRETVQLAGKQQAECKCGHYGAAHMELPAAES